MENRGKRNRQNILTCDPRMDIISILPSEITVDILLRLDVVDIQRCRRVCKSWLRVVGSDQFVSSHFSRSVPGLFVRGSEPGCCEILEFEEGNENQDYMTGDPSSTGYFEIHFNSVMRFNIPLFEDSKLDIHSSANGLLFLVKTEWISDEFYRTNYICNPITREYITICSGLACHPYELVSYGFGVSKLGKHTVFRVRHRIRGEKYIHCDVYTVGSGSWRSVAPPDPSLCADANTPFEFVKYTDGPCLDGRFHWLNLCCETPHILCFDLETELFSIYDIPLPFEGRKATLSALGDSLCLCDSTCGDKIIWLPEEMGKCWTMEFAIPKTQNLRYNRHSSNLVFKAPLIILKAFKKSGILMEEKISLFLSQTHRNTIRGLDWWKHRIRYSPSFLSLTNFNMENAISF